MIDINRLSPISLIVLLIVLLFSTLETKAQVRTDTFNYTGGVQKYVVPSFVDSVWVDVRGAAGAMGATIDGVGGLPGLGATVKSKISVSSYDTIYVYVGGAASNEVGGWNGGGDGATCGGVGEYGGGGGGATDVRLGGTSLADRVVVAGAGGGGGAGGDDDNTSIADDLSGGMGGSAGLNGMNGFDAGVTAFGGEGGNQTSGGASGRSSSGTDGSLGIGGQGGICGATNYYGDGGGGGAGYYGGGGDASSDEDYSGSGDDPGGGGGGAGSSYIEGRMISVEDSARKGNGLAIIRFKTYIQASVTPSDTNLCKGDTTLLKSSVSMVDGDTSYQWLPANSVTCDTCPQTKAFPTTTDTIALIVKDSFSTDTNYVNITVFDTANLVVSPDTSICVKDTIRLSANGLATFQWSPGSSLNDSTVADPKAYPTTSTTYYVSGTNGCGSDTDSVVLNVNPLPTPDAGADTTICLRDTAQLMANGGTSYRWQPNTDINDTSLVNPNVYPTTATKYYVTVTDGNGCQNKDSVQIGINSLPTVTTSMDSTICTGDSVQLGAMGGVDYSWQPVSSVSNAGIDSPVAFPTSTTKYRVRITDANACENVDSTTITVVNNVPTVAASGDTAICFKDSVQLMATGATRYEWSPAASINNTSIANPWAFPLDTTTYEVKGSNVCGVDSEEVQVSINPLPPAEAGDNAGFCEDGQVQLTASGGNAYLWSPTDSLSDSTIANPIASPRITTQYFVTVTDVNKCSNVDSVVVRNDNMLPIDPIAMKDSICEGESLSLSAIGKKKISCFEYFVDSIEFNPIRGSGNTVTLSNDDVSGNLPIGFDFNFYCTSYDEFRISSNGFITFSSTTNDGCCEGQTLPDGVAPNNLIAFAWEDLNPAAGGTVEYFTIGEAPYRVLVVNFIDVHHNGGGGSFEVTSQLLLYESSNVIEIHTTDMPSDGGRHTMGLEGLLGNKADTIKGRNSKDWSASVEAYRFIPAPRYKNKAQVNWSPGVAVSDSTSLKSTASPTSTTDYTVTVDNGDCQRKDKTGTVNVHPLPIAQIAHTDTNLSVDFTSMSQNATDLHWDLGDGDTSTMKNVEHNYDTAGNYQIILTAANRCGEDSVHRMVKVTTNVPDYLPVVTDVSVYPNPTQQYVHLELVLEKDRNVSVEIYDTNGRLINKKNYNRGQSIRDEFKLNQPSGLYLMSIKVGKHRIEKNIMLQR